MTPRGRWRSLMGAPAVLAGSLIVMLFSSVAVGAVSPEALRACIASNLPRYTTPEDATLVQYANLETACIAALEGGLVSMEFAPAESNSGASAPSGATLKGGGGRLAGNLPPAAPETRATAGRPKTRAAESRVAFVRAALGSPADPSSTGRVGLTSAALWITLIVGGVLIIIIGSTAWAIRRRPR